MKDRLYDYKCTECSELFSAIRPEEERRNDIECPHCSKMCNGEKGKLIGAVKAKYAQGKLKGRMNNGGY
jgi:DNA-directed RNA polymerase subunit RPC12/RpoP